MRPEKVTIVEELRGKLRDALYVILADYRGMSVARTETLRRQLRGVGAEAQVVPNRLFKIAGKDLTPPGFEKGLIGPSLMVYGQGDLSRAAKVLRTFIKENEMPVIKLGTMRGALLSKSDVDAMALLPPREVLLAQLVGLLAAPMQRLVGVLQAKTASILYVLKAIQEKKEKA
jgi:large subunit ribosomal protein L10